MSAGTFTDRNTKAEDRQQFGVIAEQLEKLRAKLLDLTTRNPLISFKHSARSKRFVRLIDEVPDHLYRRLDDDATMRFRSLGEANEGPADERSILFRRALDAAKLEDAEYKEGLAALGEYPGEKAVDRLEDELRVRLREQLGMTSREPASRITPEAAARQQGLDPSFDLPVHNPGATSTKHSDAAMQTLLFAGAMESTLAKLLDQVRLSVSETGVNPLFCVFGFIEWYEDENSEVPLHAPLLLYPLQIERELVRGHFQYTVKSTGEGATLNVAIVERLRRDFQIVLPDFPEDSTPEHYFALVHKVLGEQKSWKLRRWATVGLFSFARIAMYHDLDPKNWKAKGGLERHRQISRLINGTGGGDDTIRPRMEEATVNGVEDAELEIPLVSDADSSQLAAAREVLAGHSLVIEGPPGTGKSQTITNIIAAAIAAGKTVLFLAEKNAALSVVKNRLQRAGLQDFCLELHSTKAGKKETSKVLATRLGRRAVKSVDADLQATLAEIDSTKRKLRQCVEALAQPAGNLGISTHDLLWRCSSIRQRTSHLPSDIDTVTFDHAERITEVDLSRATNMANRLERVRQSIADTCGSPRQHPWFGVARADLDVIRCEDLVRHMRYLADVSATAAEILLSLRATAGCAPDRWSGLSNLAVLQTLPPPEQPVDSQIVRKLADRQTLASMLQFVADVSEQGRLRSIVSGDFQDNEHFEACDPAMLLRFAELVTKAGLADTTMRELSSVAERREKEAAAWDGAYELMKEIAQRAGFADALSASVERGLVAAVSLAAEAGSKVAHGRTGPLVAAGSLDLIKQAHARLEGLRKRRAVLREAFAVDSEVSSGELLSHARALRTAPAIPYLNRAWWKARAIFNGLCKAPIKARRNQMATHLEDIARYVDDSVALRHDESLRVLFGSSFNGLETDAAPAAVVAAWADKVRASIPSHNAAGAAIRTLLLEGSADQIESLAALATHPRFGDLARVVSAQRAEDATIETQRVAIRQRMTATRDTLQLGLRLGLRGDRVAGVAAKLGVDLKTYRSLTDDIRNSRTAAETMERSFQGEATDLVPLVASIKYVQGVTGLAMDPRLRDWLLQGDPHQRWSDLRPYGDRAAEVMARLMQVLKGIEGVTKVDYQAWIAVSNPLDANPSELAEHAGRCADDPEGLQVLVDLARLAADLEAEGYAPALAIVYADRKQLKGLGDACRRVVYQSLVRSILSAQPALAGFSGERFEGYRSQFRELDRKLQRLRQSKIAFDLARRAIDPGSDTGSRKEWTGLAMVRLEAEKQRAHASVRDLLHRGGKAIQQLMPCFMMSPLSVAQYLKPGALHFDMVIMDEASQLRPEDAIGAIARAEQVVIVGDPKQLPPTSFFDRGDVPLDEDDEGTAADEKSILELASSIMQVRRLTWHYRSTHPALIAFSNREFYDNKLVVFPSPKHEDPSLGVRYVHVAEGCYKAGVNPPEAQHVAQAAVEHARQYPDRTLGIVTLNKAQAELLSLELDRLAVEHPEFEQWRKKYEGGLEPFFVKNLENVQGDERDCIFIATVYGRDEAGNVYQRFGPINAQGGHRRLNVLFTRAKCQTTVFSTMEPGDIRADEASPWGVRALKGFLKFAKDGLHDIPMASGREPDSDFEVAVAEVLRSEGYNVVPQVGVAGYFIDLAVRHPELPGEFVLGIECDGATYHTSKSARDRDRLRQEILERLKWRIHRIWSLDWFRNYRREKDRLLLAVREAIAVARAGQ